MDTEHRLKVRLSTAGPYCDELERALLAVGQDAAITDSWGSRAGIQACAATRDIDVLHLQWPEAMLSEAERVTADARALNSLASCLSLARTHARVALTCHNVHPHEPLDRAFHRDLYELVVTHADILLHHTSAGARRFANTYAAALAKRSARIPHPPFRFTLPDRASARLTYRIADDHRLWILCLGSILPYKGYDLLLEAVARADARRFGVLLCGPCGDETYLRTMAGRIERVRNAKGEARVLARWMTQEEVAAAIAACDLVAACHDNGALTSGMPHIAAGCGRALLATPDNAYVREVASDFAILSAERTPESLIATLTSLTDDSVHKATAAAIASGSGWNDQTMGAELARAYDARSVDVPLLVSGASGIAPAFHNGPSSVRVYRRNPEANATRVYVVEPHIDDAILSVGGAMARSHAPVTVITVFSASATWHPQAGRGVPPTIRTREAEAAARALDFEWRSLGLSGCDAKDVEATAQRVAHLLKAVVQPGGLVLLPAACGGHPEHLAVARCATRFPRHVLYEDVSPIATYARLTEEFWFTYDALAGAYQARYVGIDKAVERKLAASALYRSQFSFGQAQSALVYARAVALSMRHLAGVEDGPTYAERLFVPCDAAVDVERDFVRGTWPS